MTSTDAQPSPMRSTSGTAREPSSNFEAAGDEPPTGRRRIHAFTDQWLGRLARRNLLLLAARGDLFTTLRDIPRQMHRVARETELVIEFVDDIRARRYRAPWWAVAVAASALLYAVNPADAVPNFIPIAGMVDDLAVVAVATRVLRNELHKYCDFKGYPISEYF